MFSTLPAATPRKPGSSPRTQLEPRITRIKTYKTQRVFVRFRIRELLRFLELLFPI